MGWALVAAAVVAVVLADPGGPARAQQDDLPELTSDERLRAGEIYAGQCATCHGADGGGGQVPVYGGEAPPLAGNDEVTVPYLDLVLRTGRMPPAGNPWDNRARREPFDEETRRILVTYLTEQFGLEGRIPEVAEGNAARGQDVWNTHCAHCHGNTGAGGVAGGGAWTPAIEQYDPVTIAEGIRVGPFQMPAFDRTQIRDQEIADVAAYMQEVREEPGTLLNLVELNPVYVSAFVALMALVLLFSLMWIAGRPTWFPDPEGQGSRRGGDAGDDRA